MNCEKCGGNSSQITRCSDCGQLLCYDCYVKHRICVGIPDTVKYLNSFKDGVPQGFDGIMNWQWTKEVWKDTKIEPMDFDSVTERRGHFFVIESKAHNQDIPQGQIITLESLQKPKSFTVMIQKPKGSPEVFEIWPGRFSRGKKIEGRGIEMAQNYLKQWRKWAETN